MVRVCAFPGCGKKMKHYNPESFHRLPLQHNDTLKQWLVILHIDVETPVKLLREKDYRVCSNHFKKDDFVVTRRTSNPPRRHRLKKSAVPRAERPVADHVNETRGSEPSAPQIMSHLAALPQSTPKKFQHAERYGQPPSFRFLKSAPEHASVRPRTTPTSATWQLTEDMGAESISYWSPTHAGSEAMSHDMGFDCCETTVCETDESSSESLDSVGDETEPDETEPDETEPDETEPDETEPQPLPDKHLSEPDPDLSLNLLCYTDSDSDQDDKSSKQTAKKTHDIACNTEEQQLILQTTLKTCSVKLEDCRNLMEINTETTEEEDDDTDDEEDKKKRYNDDDDDFVPSDESNDDDGDHSIPSDEINESSDEEKPHKCRYCKKKYPSEWTLAKHMRIHSKKKPYQCSVCGKTFKLLDYVIIHEKIHSEEKPFPCSHCDKSFTNQHSLKLHNRVHTGEKPYLCQHCGKSFAIQQNLKFHQRVHTKEKPYHCSQCGQSFARPQTYKIHLKVHLGVKPYPCNICGKSFTRQDNLATHQRIHTGEKPYKCTQCDMGFTQAVLLRLHQKKHTAGKL